MRAGELIDERYLLEKRAGAGGFGAVWRALDRVTGSLVVPKQLDRRAEPCPTGSENNDIVCDGLQLRDVERHQCTNSVTHDRPCHVLRSGIQPCANKRT